MFYFIAYTLIALFLIIGVNVAARIMDAGDRAARAEHEARVAANVAAKNEWIAENENSPFFHQNYNAKFVR